MRASLFLTLTGIGIFAGAGPVLAQASGEDYWSRRDALLSGYTPVTEEMLRSPPPGDWLMWRGNYGHWGHSPLNQIDRSNVGGLRLAWAWTLAEGNKQRTTPLVHDGIMFLTQHCDYVEAVDARNGTPLWDYQRPLVEHNGVQACANRNAALYGDRLFIGTHDAHLVALDVRTGEVVWDQTVGDWTLGHHYSGGPMIMDGKVVAGMSGCYMVSSRCWVSAHDIETGEEIWRTHTIPGPGEFGYDTWGDVPESHRIGGSAWIAPSYDPELDLIYTGVAVPTLWGAAQRGTGDGDILYTNSTLALDADTGEIVWYFQYMPNDEWDLDHPFPRILVESEVAPVADAVEWLNPDIPAGERRKVVTGIPGKTGIIWTLDARTGEFLWARSTSYQNVVVGVDIENHKGILNPELTLPAIGEVNFVCPSATGGINWQAVAYNPQTNALYTPTNNLCMNYSLSERHARPGIDIGQHHRSVAFGGGGPIPDPPGSDGTVGLFSAVDVATGETKWELRQRPGIGGSVLSTGGGLVFVTDDARRFRAFDAETGEVLWEQILNTTAGGYPVSYMVDGVQYIAIAAGAGQDYLGRTPEVPRPRPGGNMLYVFRLP